MPHKGKHLLENALLGAVAGLVAWGLLALSPTFVEYFTISPFVIHGITASAGLGAILLARDPLLKHLPLNEVALHVFRGAVIGGVSGWLAFRSADYLLAYQVPPFASRLVGWGVLGLLLGGASCVFHARSHLILRPCLGGGAGGLAGGLLVELVALTPFDGTAQAVALLAYGLTYQLVQAGLENLTSHAQLRVINGPQIGQSWLLSSPLLSLGYGRHADLRLSGYTEVCAHHADLRIDNEQMSLQNVEKGGELEVNFRKVHQQPLKDGDIIKAGSALLQYCET